VCEFGEGGDGEANRERDLEVKDLGQRLVVEAARGNVPRLDDPIVGVTGSEKKKRKKSERECPGTT
jgi:hypothetical protein